MLIQLEQRSMYIQGDLWYYLWPTYKAVLSGLESTIPDLQINDPDAGMM